MARHYPVQQPAEQAEPAEPAEQAETVRTGQHDTQPVQAQPVQAQSLVQNGQTYVVVYAQPVVCGDLYSVQHDVTKLVQAQLVQPVHAQPVQPDHAQPVQPVQPDQHSATNDILVRSPEKRKHQAIQLHQSHQSHQVVDSVEPVYSVDSVDSHGVSGVRKRLKNPAQYVRPIAQMTSPAVVHAMLNAWRSNSDLTPEERVRMSKYVSHLSRAAEYLGDQPVEWTLDMDVQLNHFAYDNPQFKLPSGRRDWKKMACHSMFTGLAYVFFSMQIFGHLVLCIAQYHWFGFDGIVIMLGWLFGTTHGSYRASQLKARFHSKRNLRATSVYSDTRSFAAHGKQFRDNGGQKFDWQVSHDMLLDKLAQQHDKIAYRKWRTIAQAWAENARKLGFRALQCVICCSVVMML